MRPCNEAIEDTIKLTETMLSLSDRGDAVREDNGCGILYGILRDSAFKIRKAAEAEKEKHKKNSKWK
ncbi:MAG: hypothetical protein GY864_04110 [Desulfobacterales bacterium]|nr:hypothetical protein [Desulfobacterales bacterium]